MILSSKAKNLIILDKLNLKNSQIPKFLKYTIEEINENKFRVIENIKKKFKAKNYYQIIILFGG